MEMDAEVILPCRAGSVRKSLGRWLRRGSRAMSHLGLKQDLKSNGLGTRSRGTRGGGVSDDAEHADARRASQTRFGPHAARCEVPEVRGTKEKRMNKTLLEVKK